MPDRTFTNTIPPHRAIYLGNDALLGDTYAMAMAVLSQKQVVVDEKTRPANTTAYAATDVVSENAATGTVWTFALMARVNGGGGYVIKARLVTDEVTGQTQRLRLYLFNVAPTGVLNDNALSTEPLYADVLKMVGTIDFDALDNTMGSADSAETQRDDLRLPYSCAALSTTLYGILVTLDAFTPVSGQKFHITLEVEHTT